MKPRIKIAAARTPDGGEMELYQHDRDFTIMINGEDLMLSRHHESELELARLGCSHLGSRQAPNILIGGLGMGYTLRQTLNMLNTDGKVVVGELMPVVVEWNRKYLGLLNGNPLEDKRIEIVTGDVFDLISGSRNKFDAILLDVDNGPCAITDSANNRLYGYEGIAACHRALRSKSCLAVWSTVPSKEFEELLMSCSFHVRRYRVPVYKGSKSQARYVWVASEAKSILPPGGGEPRKKRHIQKSKSRRKK